MYGLIGKITAHSGQRAALTAILTTGTQNMPGCISYVIANCTGDTNGIWITEVWDSKDAHAASLQLPSVQAAIAEGRPLIAEMKNIAATEPLPA